MSDAQAERFKDLTGANDDGSSGGGGGIANLFGAFTGAAATGNLKLGDEPGHHILKAIETARDELTPVTRNSRFLTMKRKLGHSGQAETLKQYLPTVADDHPDAMVPRIREFLSKLDELESAVHNGMNSYRQDEQDNVDFFRTAF